MALLNPAAARMMIQRQGEQVRWLQALPCDCSDPADPDYGDARSCEDCEHGYVYREQDLDESVRALVTRQTREFLHPEIGMIAVGDLTVTTMADELPISDYDKLVLIERSTLKKERVAHDSTGLVDALGEDYPTAVQTVADGDTVFTAGEDFIFDEGAGTIVWLDGGARPDGQVYAAAYEHAPVYWYTGARMTAARPMPGHEDQWPQSGLLQVQFPNSEG